MNFAREHIVVSDRWDATNGGAWASLLRSQSRAVVDVRGLTRSALSLSDSDENDSTCPYFSGLAEMQKVSAAAFSTNKTASNDGGRHAYAEASGYLFASPQIDKKPSVRQERDEPLGDIQPVRPPPVGSIVLSSVTYESFEGIAVTEVKSRLEKRFANGRCDVSGLTKVFFVYVLSRLAKRVTGAGKTSGRCCCELDCTGTALGSMDGLPGGGTSLPTRFDTETFEVRNQEKGVEPFESESAESSFTWPDFARVRELSKKRPKPKDAYDSAVFAAQTNVNHRSTLLAFLTGPIILSRVHIITTLILDKCALRDADAALLASILRSKPSPSYSLLVRAESLREGHVVDGGSTLSSPPLRVISLRVNYLTDIGVMLLKKAVKYHPIIEEIHLEGNNLIRCGEGLSIPPDNLTPNPPFLVPFFDSATCGGNEEIIVLRQRLQMNRQRNVRDMELAKRDGCFHCF